MFSLRLSRRPLSTVTAWTYPLRGLHDTTCNRAVDLIKSDEHFQRAVSGKPRVVIDCFATWCGPCKAIAPVLNQLAEEPGLKERVHFFKFDVDELPQVAQQLGVRAMPTFVFFKDGDKQGEVIGADPKALAAAVRKLAED